jgi:hypothetical protein
MEIKGSKTTAAPPAAKQHGGQHQVYQGPGAPDPNAKLTGEQQSALDRFRRIEQRDERVAYAWLANHNAVGTPQNDAYNALMLTIGIEGVNAYFNKYGQLGQGAAFGPGGSRRSGFVWAYYASGNGDFGNWEGTFDHNSITLPPPNIAAVVVDVQ